MDELALTLKMLSDDILKGDTALFQLCNAMIERINEQQKQILVIQSQLLRTTEGLKLVADAVVRLNEEDDTVN